MGRSSGSTTASPSYTVGQRQGLGVALGEPRYVSSLDPLSNTIQLARRADLETHTVDLERVSFVDGAAPNGRRAVPRRRSGSAIGRGSFRRTVAPLADADGRVRWRATTDEPVWAVAPGQACVLYDGDVVVGGGRIARSAEARIGSAVAACRERRVNIGPAPVLALLVGIFHTALFLVIRGHGGGQVPLLVIAAVLGAWAGDALGARLGIDVLRIGDFRLLTASLVAWIGIGLTALAATIGPTRRRTS